MQPEIKSIPYIDKFGTIIHDSSQVVKVMSRYEYKGILQYTQVHYELIEILSTLRTLTPLRTLLQLILLNAKSGASDNLVKITQTELAKILLVTQPDVSKALITLQEVGFIVGKARGIITLNPRYVWKGNLNSRQESIEQFSKI